MRRESNHTLLRIRLPRFSVPVEEMGRCTRILSRPAEPLAQGLPIEVYRGGGLAPRGVRKLSFAFDPRLFKIGDDRPGQMLSYVDSAFFV